MKYIWKKCNSIVGVNTKKSQHLLKKNKTSVYSRFKKKRYSYILLIYEKDNYPIDILLIKGAWSQFNLTSLDFFPFLVVNLGIPNA